ncbi:MAG: VOC family protein [Candidatus Liptonbacteria bacterium]|nr:VOC family protein [Candidatus Liptonbacteria bacterium]
MSRSIKGIDHIAISVEDLERSAQFYKEIFGFEEAQRFARADLRGKAVFLKLGNARLEIWEFEDKKEPKDDLKNLKIKGIRHIAFSVADVRNAYEELKMKVDISEPRTGASEGVYCFLSDPDGIQIELYGS